MTQIDDVWKAAKKAARPNQDFKTSTSVYPIRAGDCET
jgi:hypothetical protein